MEKRYNNGMKAIFNYLEKLAKNNNREWFMANKEEFDSLRVVFEFMVQEFIDKLSHFDHSLKGVRAKDCIFRIYRDIRFSPNKIPYKTHFGAWITRNGRKGEYPGYYIHLEPGNSLFAAGVWCPDPKLVKQIRSDIYNNFEEFSEIIYDKKFIDTFGRVQGSSLKTLPREFSKDFKEPYLLMLKDFFIEHDVDFSFFDENWVEKASKLLHNAYPFNQFLEHTVEDFLE